MNDFFRVLYGEIPTGTSLLVRFIADPEKDMGANKGVLYAKHFTDIEGLPESYRLDCNVFFGVGLRKQGTSQAVLWPVLFVDMDETGWPMDLPDGVPLPTAVVRSGKGVHLYWKLDACIGDKEEAYHYLRALQATLKADPRAAEPERILRVPDTLNVKYSPPIKCELLELHPERVYSLTDFELVQPKERIGTSKDRILPEAIDIGTVRWADESLGTLAWMGWSEDHKGRFKSASDLDFAVCLALARAGYSREQVKGVWEQMPGLMRTKAIKRPDYVDTTIHRAFEVVADRAKAQQAASDVGLYADDGRRVLFTTDAKGNQVQISNFVAEANAIFEGQDGGIRVTLSKADGRRDTFTLPVRALSSVLLFKQSIPAHYVWSGDSRDLSRFHQYLLNQSPKEKAPFPHLGLYQRGDLSYVVGSNAVLGPEGFEDAPVVYSGQARWNLEIGSDWKNKAREAIDLLLQLHQPEVVWALLGWTMTTFIAPKVREVRGGNASSNGEFSGLWVWGEQGSGKSRTTEQFTRLTGTPFTNLAEDSTRAALHVALSTSNLLPVFVDDPRRYFRRGADDPAILDVMRHAFNGTTVGKGRKDLSGIIEQPLMAPVIVTSEQAIEHDTALAERYLHVLIYKQYLRDHSECAQVLERLADMPLERLAAGFHLYFWSMDVKRTWEWANGVTSGLRSLGAEDRSRKSIAQVLVGLQMAEDVLAKDFRNVAYSEIAERLYRRSVESTVREDTRVGPALSEFINLIWNMMATRKLVEKQDYRVVGDALFIGLNRLVYESIQASERFGLPLSRSTVMQIIKNHTGDVIAGMEKITFPGAKTNQPTCVVFNISRIKEDLGIGDEPWNSVGGVFDEV